MKIDGKAIKAQQADASHKYADAIATKNHATSHHDGYSVALVANTKARDAYVALQVKMAGIIGQLASEDAHANKPPLFQSPNDPGWYEWLGAIQSDAWQRDTELGGMRQQILASMAQYVSLVFPPAEKSNVQTAKTPEAAAAAVDAATKKGGLGPYRAPPNPNAKTPDAQSSSAPPVNVQHDPEAMPGWWAAAALVGAGLAARVLGWL